jgi:hypothetical protein
LPIVCVLTRRLNLRKILISIAQFNLDIMSSFYVSYSIIDIPTKSGTNEIKSFVVVFIPLLLTLGCIVERHRDHVRLMDNLPNSTTLAQKIVMSSIFPVTKLLAIEHHKLHNTFFLVAFGSQSPLKLTSDQIGSDTN